MQPLRRIRGTAVMGLSRGFWNQFAREHGLTGRECDVLSRLAVGYSNQAIADELGISPNTIRAHRRQIYLKLAVHNERQLFAAILERAAGEGA